MFTEMDLCDRESHWDIEILIKVSNYNGTVQKRVEYFTLTIRSSEASGFFFGSPGYPLSVVYYESERNKS